MSITKYKTARFRPARIEAVEVERETVQSVWINGRKNAKRSSWDAFHDSWDEAHAYLLALAESKLKGARRDLELAQSEHGNVKGMKPPKAVA